MESVRVRCCSVPGCKDTTSVRHRFPKREPDVFKVWVDRVKHPRFQVLNPEGIYKAYFVCGRHFTEDCRIKGSKLLKRRVLPSLYLPGFSEEISEIIPLKFVPTIKEDYSNSEPVPDLIEQTVDPVDVSRVIPEHTVYLQQYKIASKISNIQPMEVFDCEGETASVAERWAKWKHGFEIYLQAINVHNDTRKRAILLHSGGTALQEIAYNIPGAMVEPNNSNNIYDTIIQKLDEYFTPKQSKVYDRYIFRLMKQETGEKFEQFLARLQNQASKCGFLELEKNLIDQITEKCSSEKLRKKILSIGDEITLDDIISEANVIEIITKRLEELEEMLK